MFKNLKTIKNKFKNLKTTQKGCVVVGVLSLYCGAAISGRYKLCITDTDVYHYLSIACFLLFLFCTDSNFFPKG